MPFVNSGFRSESFEKNVSNLTCRLVIEESHNESIIQVIEEKEHNGLCRYLASISPKQVNIYDNEDVNTGMGFFAHYVLEKTDYFRGGEATNGCWIYSQQLNPDDSIIAVGTSLGEIFLLSCIDCRILSIYSNPTECPIVSISVSPKYPSKLLVIDSEGILRLWDINTKSIDFCDSISDVRFVCWESDNALLLLKDGNLSMFCPANNNVRELSPSIIELTQHDCVTGILALPQSGLWCILTSVQIVLLNMLTESILCYLVDLLPEYFNPTRFSITRDEKHLLISDNSRSRVLTIYGDEVDILIDNFAIGMQNTKEPSSYRKINTFTSILHPDGRYAVMIESNRVLRFDSINADAHYVAHVKYPYPVEDMYVFYENLNSEPLLYLHPKI